MQVEVIQRNFQENGCRAIDTCGKCINESQTGQEQASSPARCHTICPMQVRAEQSHQVACLGRPWEEACRPCQAWAPWARAGSLAGRRSPWADLPWALDHRGRGTAAAGHPYPVDPALQLHDTRVSGIGGLVQSVASIYRLHTYPAHGWQLAVPGRGRPLPLYPSTPSPVV
jgi:hypothetical protein